MRPIILDIDLAEVDPNSVFEDQTLAGADSFVLDGAGVVNGEWVTPDGFARQISFESAGDLSALTLAITGYTDPEKHNLITEALAGPNATTVESTNYFYYITDIASNGAVGTNVEAGFVDEAVTQPLPINWRGGIAAVNIDVVGTINITIQQTFDEIQNLNDLNFNWQDAPDTTLVGATTSVNGSYEYLPRALRAKINSYSTGAECQLVIQQRNM